MTTSRKPRKARDPLKKRTPSVAANLLARLERFLVLYAEGGTVRSNARKCELSSCQVHRAVRANAEFAEKFYAAQELNTDDLEDQLHNVGLVFNNVSAITATLKKRRPKEWKQAEAIDVNAKVEHQLESAKREELIGTIMALVTPQLLLKQKL